MIRFCPKCGTYRQDKQIDQDEPSVICPECNHAETFLQLPLLSIGGASGVGKSTIYRELIGQAENVVLLDVDAMWEPEFSEIPGSFDYNSYYLRQCKNIGQSGRPVTIFGAEIGMPGIVETSVQRRYFTDVYYLALACDEEVQIKRLRARPNWETAEDRWTEIDEQVAVNRWYKRRGTDPTSPIEVLDVTNLSVEAAAIKIRTWIDETLEMAQFNTPC